MAGYSGTPLPKKLGIREGHTVLLLNAPEHFATQLSPMPADVTLRTSFRGQARFDVVVLFAKSLAMLTRRFPPVMPRMQKDGGLWVCWPKKSSGVATDLSDGVVREYGLGTGLVDNKVCAVDETWSGLRFVIRRENR